MSEGVLTKCVFVPASWPHVTFHTMLLGHSSFVSLSSNLSNIFPWFLSSETSDRPAFFFSVAARA